MTEQNHETQNAEHSSAQQSPAESPEEMGAFFDARAAGYDEHMRETGYEEEYYRAAADSLPETERPLRILDLGCGTGLELASLFARVPNARVTCIDLSAGMLSVLRENHRDQAGRLTLICASYLDWDYPQATFDACLSVTTMHHFTKEEKTALYRKICDCLRPGGLYAESDFVASRQEMEQALREYQRLTAERRGEMPNSGYYHIDIPFTVELQEELLRGAGFEAVHTVRRNAYGNQATFVAVKAAGANTRRS